MAKEKDKIVMRFKGEHVELFQEYWHKNFPQSKNVLFNLMTDQTNWDMHRELTECECDGLMKAEQGEVNVKWLHKDA